jgi:peroxiredoxin Q/BCP
VRLRHFRGRKVILYFYIRDDTPGCTKQACDFRDNLERLKAENVVVLGISPDTAESHARFAAKFKLPFSLLADEKSEAAKSYGVWGKKNMYGRTFHGIVRSTFIIDEEGKVMKEYRRVRAAGHLDKIPQDTEL